VHVVVDVHVHVDGFVFVFAGAHL